MTIEYNGTVSAEAPTEQRSVALPPTSGHLMINYDLLRAYCCVLLFPYIDYSLILKPIKMKYTY